VWVYAWSSEAVKVVVLSVSRIARDWLSCSGLSASSNRVRVPSGCMRTSCCHSNPVPGPGLKSESLPPSVQITLPVLRLISYTPQVLRADTSRFPSGSCWIELTWK
jgi:hypothetical protein